MSTTCARPGQGWAKRAGSAARLAAVVVLPAVLLTAKVAGDRAGHDAFEFHAAARLIAAGENPYGVAEQTRAQRPLREGPGGTPFDPNDRYDRLGYLPYFYPPWLALAWAPVAALGFPAGRVAWIYLGAQCLTLSGFLLARPGGRVPPTVAAVLATGFMPAFVSVYVGQTPTLVLALLVVSWRLLERGSDAAAGVALAWLTLKPQLAVVAVPAALVWAARRGRWGVVRGFAATLALLAAACFAFFPGWPLAMLSAIRRTPLPTDFDPTVGVTWLSLLRTLGARGPLLAAGYAALAVPAVAAVLASATSARRSTGDVLAGGTVAAFVVAPYALGYDLAVLLFPLALRLRASGRLTGLALAALFGLAPYAQIVAVVDGLRPVTMVWLPLGLAVLGAARWRRHPFLWSAWQTRSMTTAEARISTSSPPGATSTP